ncbi:MAG: hypothetical protein ACPGYL_08755, partial [Rhodospirillaceae bacterium]
SATDDGNGGAALTTQSNSIFLVERVDDQPDITLSSGITVFDMNAAGTASQIDASVTFVDDELSYDGFGGTVMVYEGGEEEDRLEIIETGGITVSGTTVSYNSQAFATLDNAGGSGSNAELSFTFNSFATQTSIQALFQAVGFDQSSSNGSSGERTVDFIFGEGYSSFAGASRLVVVAPTSTSPSVSAGEYFVHTTANLGFSTATNHSFDYGGVFIDNTFAQLDGTHSFDYASFITSDGTLRSSAETNLWSFGNSSTASVSLEVDGMLDFDGGTIQQGTVQVDGSFTSDGSLDREIGSGTYFDLNGSGTITGGTTTIDGFFENDGHLRLYGNFATPPITLDGTGLLRNDGTLEVSETTETVTISTELRNNGTLEVDSGTLTLAGGGQSVGDIELGYGANLRFASSFNLAGGTIDQPGIDSTDATLDIDSTVFVNGSVGVDSGVAIDIQQVSDGSFALFGTGTLESDGDITWHNGEIDGVEVISRGLTTLTSNFERDLETGWTNHGTMVLDRGTLEIDSGGTLTNHGTLELDRGLLDVNSSTGTISNESSGLIEIAGSETLQLEIDGGLGNLGRIEYSRADRTSLNGTLTSSGTLDIQSGTLSLEHGTLSNDIYLDDGTALRTTGTVLLSDATISNNYTYSGNDGTLEVFSGQLSLAGSSAIDVTSDLELNSGKIGNSDATAGTLSVASDFYWTSGSLIGDNVKIFVDQELDLLGATTFKSLKSTTLYNRGSM